MISRDASEEARTQRAWRDPGAACQSQATRSGVSREPPEAAASLPSAAPCSGSQQSSRHAPVLFAVHTKHRSSAPRRGAAQPVLRHSRQPAVSLRSACVPGGMGDLRSLLPSPNVLFPPHAFSEVSIHFGESLRSRRTGRNRSERRLRER